MTGIQDKKFAVLFGFALFGAGSLVGFVIYGINWALNHVHIVVR